MSDDQSSSDSGNSSWIGKLTNMFTDQVDDTKSLVTFLRKAEQNQVIDADGLSIIEGALQVTDMQVREIMIPRSQVATIDITDSPDEIIPKVIQAGHSRFPGDRRKQGRRGGHIARQGFAGTGIDSVISANSI